MISLLCFGLLSNCLTRPIAITNVSVVVPGQARAIPGQTVVLMGDRIIAVEDSKGAEPPKDAEKIDGTGKYLMPGLWDMHVHILERRDLGLFTANGVTGIRIMFGGPAYVQWRREGDAGEVNEPRIVTAGPIVDGPKPVWPGCISVGTDAEARAAVRTIKQQGYDFVKVYSMLPREAYFAIADECKKQGIPFEGHVPFSVSYLEAAKAGQRSAEHLMNLAIDCSSREDELRKSMTEQMDKGFAAVMQVFRCETPEIERSYDPAKFKSLLASLSRSGMWQCPTLVVLRATAYFDETRPGADSRLKYVDPSISGTWDPAKDFRYKARTEQDWLAAKRAYKTNLRILDDMQKAGMPILAGSDCLNPNVFPGFSLHDELALMVQAGLSPSQALATATLNPARYYGKERVAGTVSAGKNADLVLLNANPLRDIRNTRSIAAVIQRGRLYARPELDQMLKSCEYRRASGRFDPQTSGIG